MDRKRERWRWWRWWEVAALGARPGGWKWGVGTSWAAEASAGRLRLRQGLRDGEEGAAAASNGRCCCCCCCRQRGGLGAEGWAAAVL